jgi:hypothetical protein
MENLSPDQVEKRREQQRLQWANTVQTEEQKIKANERAKKQRRVFYELDYKLAPIWLCPVYFKAQEKREAIKAKV